jgi:hypothetical protein
MKPLLVFTAIVAVSARCTCNARTWTAERFTLANLQEELDASATIRVYPATPSTIAIAISSPKRAPRPFTSPAGL